MKYSMGIAKLKFQMVEQSEDPQQATTSETVNGGYSPGETLREYLIHDKCGGKL